MDFPNGRILQRLDASELDISEVIKSLQQREFTGVLKYFGEKPGNLLFIRGEIVAITYGKEAGDTVGDTLLEKATKGGNVEIHQLDPQTARSALRYYTDVLGHSIAIWKLEDARKEVMRRAGIAEPDLATLENMLESEGMSHLLKKPSEEVIAAKKEVTCGWDAVGLMDQYPVPHEAHMNILVMGGPNPYKQLWCQQYVYGELVKGLGALYFNFNTTPDDIRMNLVRLGMDIEGFEKENRFYFIDCFPWRLKKSPEPFHAAIDKSSLLDFGLALSEASQKVEADSGVVVFDSLSNLMIYFDPDQVIKFAVNQASKLKEMEWTGLYIVEQGVNDAKIENSLRFLLDGVFEIGTTEKKYLGEFKIDWIRGIVDKPATYYFDVSQKGLSLVQKK
ncbi:MAG: RAD55 family ATPase [Candidatus Methanofastidiosia archaeon]|jgi:KaiC/GvpD/RAD55 family RecA-like ATPase